MRVRIVSFCLPFALLSLLSSASSVTAEFRCSADISYKWVKKPAAEASRPEAPRGVAVGPTPTPVSPTPTPEPAIVRLLGIERAGGDEATAKGALQMEADRQRIRASEACKREHEAFGTCVALKMSSRSTVLNSLSFSARAELEKALAEECRQQEGTCVGVEVSEPKCREIVTAQPSPSPAPEKSADTKGGKQPAKDAKKK